MSVDAFLTFWRDVYGPLSVSALSPKFVRVQDDVGHFIASDRSPYLLTWENVILPYEVGTAHPGGAACYHLSI